MKLQEFRNLIRKEIQLVLNETSIPDNIKKRFKNDPDAMSVINKVSKWALKSNSVINGGTTIGKDYNTLVLDLSNHGRAVHINLDDYTITVNNKKVTNEKSFTEALNRIK